MTMIGITCTKCNRRFTPSAEDVQAYLAQSEGKKYVQVICPHCNYGNKIAVQRLQQSVHTGAATGQQAGTQAGGQATAAADSGQDGSEPAGE
jgi:phage FluMu protein Com